MSSPATVGSSSKSVSRTAGVRLESFSGRIRSCDGVSAERASRFGPGQRLAFTRGAGTAQVQARSLSGEIALCEPAAVSGN